MTRAGRASAGITASAHSANICGHEGQLAGRGGAAPVIHPAGVAVRQAVQQLVHEGARQALCQGPAPRNPLEQLAACRPPQSRIGGCSAPRCVSLSAPFVHQYMFAETTRA